MFTLLETPQRWTPLRKLAAVLIFASVGVFFLSDFSKAYFVLLLAGEAVLLFDVYRQWRGTHPKRTR